MANKANLTKEEIRGHRLLILRRIIAYIVLALVVIIAIFPFVMLIINTTKSHQEISQGFSLIPGGSFIDNFKSVLEDPNKPVFQGMLNSLIVASISTVLGTYVSALTAYGIFAYDFKLKKFAFTFIMIILMVPTQVSALGYVDLVRQVGLYNSLLPLIFTAIAAPGVFFFIKQYMDSSLPMEIVEAGRIDGGHEFYIFNRVVLPILKPAMAVQLIFQFVASYNSYFLPQLVMDTNSDNATLPLVIASLNASANNNFDFGQIYFTLGVAVIPLIIVYLCFSKFIIRGVALGSVKG